MTKNEAYKIIDGAKKNSRTRRNPGPKTMNLVQEAMGVINKKDDAYIPGFSAERYRKEVMERRNQS